MKKAPKRNSAAAKPARRRPKKFTLHIVSDGTGNLAAHMITAILSQFPNVKIDCVFHVFQHSLEKINETTRKFRPGNDIVLHALVDPQLKLAMETACVERDIPHFDLTGSLVQFISDHIGVAPVNELSRLHQVNAGYFQRIEAFEFTAQHDDGLGLQSIEHAEIVIVGVSRVSKSPTSMFLASRGYKVANVSITPTTGFPAELDKVQDRVVAFTVQPKRLHEIRAVRLAASNLHDTSYDSLREVVREVSQANAEYAARGYPVIDITQMTVEQTAATVLETLKIPRKQFVT